VSDDLAALAAEAYIYGFPLVFDLQAVSGHVDMGLITPAPFNSFSHASRLAGPGDRFVRLYQPRPAVLDGSYQIPPITKAAS
jgi:hypothetical protein